MLHCWRAVNFNQPCFVVLVNHEIKTKQLKCILPKNDVLFYTLQWLNCYFFKLNFYHVFKHVLTLENIQLLTELFFRHHVLWYSVLKAIDSFRNWVVSQMNFTVFQVLWFICLWTKSDIALIINPNSKRFKIGQNNPLPYIKLFLSEDERSLYVFLHHPGYLLANNVV